jgi:hypothetical protein
MTVGKDYTVGPMPDSSMWKVESNGRRVSKHRKKSRALKKARDLADRNDTVSVQDRNGRFQRRFQPRG